MTFRSPSRRTAARGFALVATLLAGMSVAAAQDAAPAQEPAPAAKAAPVDPKAVVATIKGDTITEADITIGMADFAEELSRVPEPQRRRAVLDVLIDLKLMAKAAEAAGLDKSDEFARRLDILKARALRNEYFRDKVEASITDEAIKKRYDDEIAKITPQDEVHALHILVDNEDEAKAIIKELDAGGDFAQLAKDKSKDPGSAQMGGDLGYFTKGKMVPEFEAAAFALEPGKYTEAPVKSQFGFHVIKVVDKRKQPLPPFDQVKDQVRQLVLRDMFVQTVDQLRKDGQIDILDPALKNAPTAPPAQ